MREGSSSQDQIHRYEGQWQHQIHKNKAQWQHQIHKHKAQWQEQSPLSRHGARGRALCVPGCQCEPTLVTPCSVSTPGCKMPQPKLVPASGCTGPCGSPCSHCHRAPALSCPPPAGPRAAPASQLVPRCQGKRFVFFFVIKRLSQKLSADPKRM